MSIRFEGVSFSYFEDGQDTIHDFSTAFDPDRISVLTGVSGCGKSTLLYLAAGLYPRNGGVLRAGKILVEGQDVGALAPAQRCRLVSMMFQNPELQFCMDTVRNELIFCLENLCTPPEQVEQEMDQALDFCGISHLKHRTLVSLSGGEKQKVMLACLVLIRPKWLLLDEPFANIDDASAAAIAAKLRRLHEEQGTGILAVDHRLDHWIGTADTLYFFRDGVIAPEAMDLHRPDPARLEQAGVIAPGVSYAPDLAPAEPGDVVLELKDLTVRYDGRAVLDGVDAAFRRGVIYAVVGESGCGKSTLFNALAGVCRYSGSALLDGVELRKQKKKHLGRIGFVTQSPQDQFIGGTVRQEIAASLREDADAGSEKILRGIRLWRYRDVSPYLLSQGQQRRLGVAALMAYDCRVLVCDEPTYAQDRTNTMAVMDELCRAARSRRAALIFSTHDRQLAEDYGDVVLRLEGGKLHEAAQSRG